MSRHSKFSRRKKPKMYGRNLLYEEAEAEKPVLPNRMQEEPLVDGTMGILERILRCCRTCKPSKKYAMTSERSWMVLCSSWTSSG